MTSGSVRNTTTADGDNVTELAVTPVVGAVWAVVGVATSVASVSRCCVFIVETMYRTLSTRVRDANARCDDATRALLGAGSSGDVNTTTTTTTKSDLLRHGGRGGNCHHQGIAMGGFLSRRGRGALDNCSSSSSSSDGSSSIDTYISDGSNTTVTGCEDYSGRDNTVASHGVNPPAHWRHITHEREMLPRVTKTTTFSSFHPKSPESQPPSTLIPRLLEPFNVAYNNKDAIVAWLRDVKQPIAFPQHNDNDDDTAVVWEDVMSVIADDTTATAAKTTSAVVVDDAFAATPEINNFAKLQRYSPSTSILANTMTTTTTTPQLAEMSTLTSASACDVVSSPTATRAEKPWPRQRQQQRRQQQQQQQQQQKQQQQQQQLRSSMVTDGKSHIRRLQSFVRNFGGGGVGGAGSGKRGLGCSSRCQGVDGHVRTCVNKRTQYAMKDYIMGCTLRSAMNCKHCKTRNVFNNRLQFWNYNNGSRDIGANNIRVAINCEPDDQGVDIRRAQATNQRVPLTVIMR